MADAPVVDKPSRQAELVGMTVFLTTFSTLFVAGRLYTRVFSSRSFGWDDVFIGLAALTSCASEGLTIAQMKKGLGLTISQVKLADLVPLLKYTQFAIFLNGIGMCFMKVGIGLSLLRLSLSKTFNYAVMGCIVLSLLVNLIVFPGVFAQCQPMNKLWNPSIEGTCWPKRASLAFSYTQTVGNIVTDFAFTFGPLFYLAKVKVSHYNRWALRGIFLIGLLATACAIAKATQLPKNQNSKDPTYDTVDLTILVVAELSAGLLAAALPPLKTTFERILVRVFRVHSGLTTPSATRSKGHSYNNSRTLRSSRRPPPGSAMGTGFEFEDDMPHSTTVYVMGDMRKIKKKREDDAMSVEDDQKHILHSGSVKTGSDGNEVEGPQGDWITKTIEYTVSDAQSMHDHGKE
ncbi:uncharacterized protein A1O5_00814 [Cladophialophora psammophila CBS 110553]|uniref:Rhodopsin domain-containing protein n=1 Tax=Cladophialophora psammophila CBS 110553 TaxID=1182543 RepID=W9XH81_9EURO|nr:uncharacterized protein A1O5_00814 [Cladophialophora psammophila CBS 110553]EXJ76306.1 hypothetical protein A1O5_00814 [Cladophialophora psammophila CBS 110553]